MDGRRHNGHKSKGILPCEPDGSCELINFGSDIYNGPRSQSKTHQNEHKHCDQTMESYHGF